MLQIPWMPDRVRHDEKRLKAVFIDISILNQVSNRPTARTGPKKNVGTSLFFLTRPWIGFILLTP